MEGNYYGMYMFEANHQCIANSTIFSKNGEIISTDLKESISARNRCEAYEEFFRLKNICKMFPEIGRIELKFDHSINGGPFYRIIDEKNVCELDYKAFSHNKWIKTPEEGAKMTGYPVKNVYT